MFIGVTTQMGEQNMDAPINMDLHAPHARVFQEFLIALQHQALICKLSELRMNLRKIQLSR